MKITITNVEEPDKNTLRQIYLQVRQLNFKWLDTSAYTLSSFDQDTAGEQILTPRVNNEIAGFISIWREDNFIHHLYIHNDYQNKGIGTQLLNAALTILKYPATLKCMKMNTSAVRFYLKNGWTPRSEGVSEHGAYILFERTTPPHNPSHP